MGPGRPIEEGREKRPSVSGAVSLATGAPCVEERGRQGSRVDRSRTHVGVECPGRAQAGKDSQDDGRGWTGVRGVSGRLTLPGPGPRRRTLLDCRGPRQHRGPLRDRGTGGRPSLRLHPPAPAGRDRDCWEGRDDGLGEGYGGGGGGPNRTLGGGEGGSNRGPSARDPGVRRNRDP